MTKFEEGEKVVDLKFWDEGDCWTLVARGKLTQDYVDYYCSHDNIDDEYWPCLGPPASGWDMHPMFDGWFAFTGYDEIGKEAKAGLARLREIILTLARQNYPGYVFPPLPIN